MKVRVLALVVVLSACRSAAPREELGSVSFEAPSGWTRSDTRVGRALTAVFGPTTNPNKETITVVRTELGPIATKYKPAMLAQLLAGAQTSLREVKASPVHAVRTDGGLAGVEVVVDFLPPGVDRRYRRVHAVLLDGTALVHVMYTAREPDAGLAVYRRVLETLREES